MRERAPASQTRHGHVDFYGYHGPSLGWVFCGWMTTDKPTLNANPEVTAIFERGRINGRGLIAAFAREDVAGSGIGFLLHIKAPSTALGKLVSVTIESAEGVGTISADQSVRFLRDRALTEGMQNTASKLVAGPDADQLGRFARRGFAGANTLNELTDRVVLEIDQAIVCPPTGLLLEGWTWFAPGTIRAIRVNCGDRSSELDLDSCLRINRPDVWKAIGVESGIAERCGFIALLHDVVTPGETLYIEVETARGEIAYRGVPQPRLSGMEAIRFLLDRLDVRYGEVADAYDRVAGPAIRLLNADRLQPVPRVRTIDFGPPPAAPTLTVIVPLYGRLDFLEYQFAFHSRRSPSMAVEFIYVLDDPGQQRHAEQLASSVYERFRIPLRLAILSRNVGFAPANNVGLELARGEFVGFVNSDVFPGSDDWMERMVDRLRADQQLGAVGPLLLYEDGSVQHQGMVYETLAEFSSWHFPIHSRKGRGRPVERGLVYCDAITAACIVMRTDVARELGGFDEAYVIGDFEDSDLCMKLRKRGLLCGVDLDAYLYHLERQSQGGSEQRWRMNLTLYNAWVHERRWGSTISELRVSVDRDRPDA